MKKFIRYGSGNKQKARVGSITRQHIVELAEEFGMTQADVIQEAVCQLWTEVFGGGLRQELADLQKKYDELYEAHCDAINQ